MPDGKLAGVRILESIQPTLENKGGGKRKCIAAELMSWHMMIKLGSIVAEFLRLNAKQEILEIVCGETRKSPALRFADASFTKNVETALL